MNVFQATKQIACADVARRLGLKESRGKFCCPYHDDKHPSMACYEDKRRFYCFSCHAWGDSVDLWAKVMGTSLREAAEQICSAFGLRWENETAEQIRDRQRVADVALLPEAVWKDWHRCMVSLLEEEIGLCTRLMEQYCDPEGWLWEYALGRACALQDELNRFREVEAKDLPAEVASWRQRAENAQDVLAGLSAPKISGRLMERMLADRLRMTGMTLGSEERKYVNRTLGIGAQAGETVQSDHSNTITH